MCIGLKKPPCWLQALNQSSSLVMPFVVHERILASRLGMLDYFSQSISWTPPQEGGHSRAFVIWISKSCCLATGIQYEKIRTRRSSHFSILIHCGAGRDGSRWNPLKAEMKVSRAW